MKKTINIIVLVFILLSTNSFATETYIDKLYSEIRGKDGVTLVNITKAMMDMFSNPSNEDSKETLGEISEQIEGIKILSIDIKESGLSDSKIKSIINEISLKYKEYEVLLEVNEKGETVKMLSFKPEKDFIMYVINQEEIVLINAKGITNFAKLMHSASLMGVDVQKMMMKHKQKAQAGE